ncbi:MAG: rhodanese-like domain-containing protein [Caldilineaceae bacterium]|nr:rhodanese-like domain-containing protein [Caldilineaceae bacterium]
MHLITRDELKQKLENGDSFKLVMTMHEIAFQQAHIPDSINIYRLEDALILLHPDDDIVVYCTHETCRASVLAYRLLAENGYRQVRRYAGGLSDWSAAGYPLAGQVAL